jgi:hypothetical protein
MLLLSCTESSLYTWTTPAYRADKLTVSGNVCTDDLHQSDFPIKVLFLIDVTQAVRGSNNDPGGMRGKAIEEMIGRWGKNPNYQFGVTIFGSKAKNLLTDDTRKPVGFTRNFSTLANAVAQIKSGGGGDPVTQCRSGRCRDIRAAVSLANSIITGDVLSSDPGEVARTTYVLILFAGGPPVPALGRCACRDKEEEKIGGKWEGCPWKECDGCKVTCPAQTVCKGSDCYPVCSPPCAPDEYCDPASGGWRCVKGQPQSPPTVQPDKNVPEVVPDTFTFHVPPPSAPGACKPETCVFAAGGNPESCEEKLLVQDVRELATFAVKNGAGQLQLHTAYLPDNESYPPENAYYPPGPVPCMGDRAADHARATRILSQMAYAGGGSFTKFASAGAIPDGFHKIGSDLYATSDALAFKELVVFNRNVLPRADGIFPDTDADGLIDDIEERIGTCVSDEDSDGDGLKDAVEVKLALDPQKPDRPVECIDLNTVLETDDDPCSEGTSKDWLHYTDKDGDELNACEERLLGTDDSLYDSDADGIPDRIEFLLGTNYLSVDTLQDYDLDGIRNRDEIRGHLDPRSNDSQDQLDLAYRYNELDEGLKQVLSFTQPKLITGLTIRSVSPQTTPGAGRLRFDPGPPPTLAWRDYGDRDTGGNFGPAVNVSKTSREGYVLTSCRTRASGGGCTEDSALKHIKVWVDGPASYPPKALVEPINISEARRNCLRFTVRNITLMQTKKHRILKTPGNNTVDLYFAEAPQRAMTGFGIFRIASVRLNYIKEPPPERRTPRTPEITFSDEDFEIGR